MTLSLRDILVHIDQYFWLDNGRLTAVGVLILIASRNDLHGLRRFLLILLLVRVGHHSRLLYLIPQALDLFLMDCFQSIADILVGGQEDFAELLEVVLELIDQRVGETIAFNNVVHRYAEDVLLD